MPPLEYRPTFVRVLSVLTWLLLGLALVLTAARQPADGLRWLPVLGLVAAVVYTAFWRPSVAVDDDAVTLRNVVRDVRVPWQRLDALDTRYALSLEVGGRRFSAWAAPAPGRVQAVRQSKQDAMALQSLGTNLQHGLRSSATPNSDSGGAALMVRARWEQALARRGGGHAEPVLVSVAWLPVTALAVTALGTLTSVLLS